MTNVETLVGVAKGRISRGKASKRNESGLVATCKSTVISRIVGSSMNQLRHQVTHTFLSSSIIMHL